MECKNCEAAEESLSIVSMGSHFQVTCGKCGSGFGTADEETKLAEDIVIKRQKQRLEELRTTDNQRQVETVDYQGLDENL